ncbi:MAG TPA: hypothetical protein DCR74_02240 [Achromobacter sp.]|uniref:hypothetical protein n=1 Tax=Achromobacter sp. TaxID=134375 RepID=UPI000EF0BAA5|nr:hypothetical protein [Achromobacter sp.]HAP24480.1 hypothetical protein [Achromobacter sp.]
MSIFSRFFGRKDGFNDSTPLQANPDIAHPLSLQVVFAAPLAVTEAALTQTLRAYHSSMKKARVELASRMLEILGMVGWGNHVVRLEGVNAPYPKSALESCVAPSSYPDDVKDEVRAHASHIRLHYVGFETDPLEQYVALAAVAGALARIKTLAALAVLNERARTSLPAGMVADEEYLAKDSVDILRVLPFRMLFCGFREFKVEGMHGVWMRSYGANAFGLPDLALLAIGQEQSESYYAVLDILIPHWVKTGAEVAAGQTRQIAKRAYMTLREPTKEDCLDGSGRVLVGDIERNDQDDTPE